MRRNMTHFRYLGFSLLFILLSSALAIAYHIGSVDLSTNSQKRDDPTSKANKKPTAFHAHELFKVTNNLTALTEVQCFEDTSYMEIREHDCSLVFDLIRNKGNFRSPYTIGPAGSYHGPYRWKANLCEMAILPPTITSPATITLAELVYLGRKVLTTCRDRRMIRGLPNTGGQIIVPETMGSSSTRQKYLAVQMRNI